MAANLADPLIQFYRKSFTELVGLHELFPGIPIMALTATLPAEHAEEFTTHYLKDPLVIKTTVNRPNIKLCVGDYDFKTTKMSHDEENQESNGTCEGQENDNSSESANINGNTMSNMQFPILRQLYLKYIEIASQSAVRLGGPYFQNIGSINVT